MPELPDVEVMKTYLDATALHQKIREAIIEDAIVLENLTPVKLRKHINGQSFESTQRYGKYLFAKLSNGGYLVLHFGMTGRLKYYKNPEKEPEYELICFKFENDYNLAYVMSRKLGHVYLSTDLKSFVDQKDLGLDVCSSDLNREVFHELLKDRRGMIKSALMDQSLMAGIGNVYSDEILFQAGVHPRQSVSDLTIDTINAIFDRMHEVLQTAIEHQADPGNYPDDYLTPLRGEKEVRCPRCNGEIQRLEVAGRSAYYCPSCQKKI
jgi:formamidopyrimidine-DNA glycosylase